MGDDHLHSDTTLYPVWNDDGSTDVQSLFKNPYFVDSKVRSSVGKYWYDEMAKFSLFLYDDEGKPNNVYDLGPEIYKRISPQGDMPYAGSGYKGSFPPEACEKFRLWYNQGGRDKKGDQFPGPHSPTSQLKTAPAAPAPIPFKVPPNPVWDSKGTEHDIKMCFTNPCWIESPSRNANWWKIMMENFQYDASVDPPIMLNLQKYDHVKAWARTIYTHVASQSMPIEPPFFDDGSVEAIRLWYNQGCPKDKTEIGHTKPPADLIPKAAPEKPFRVRKDINTLSTDELTKYRLALLKLHTDQVEPSTWQVAGFLHANWCLHYMQASFPWHRAHLLWLENQIDFPIPYWNFYSSNAAQPASQDSGIPEAFLADTFHDFNGKELPNPLRHALARNGVSRASLSAAAVKEVSRKAELLPGSDKRGDYITKNVPGYLAQIYQATQMESIGDPEGPGYAFTFAEPDLTDQNKLKYYKDHQHEFDGVLEQAHDNLHGWSGADMANNSYAAFDPLFWSFHANFDRIFETWLRKHDTDAQWSSNFPLRPFVGREGVIEVSEGNPHLYQYTTIGNMVMNSKALGYTYMAPGKPDYEPKHEHVSKRSITPIVLFPNVKCTDKTFVIHVALDHGQESDKPLVIGAPGYIGSITRLGMGPDNGNDRCIKGDGVMRRLEATKAVQDIGGLEPNSEVKLKMLVHEDIPGESQRREVPESEYKGWQGFRPIVVWAKPVAGLTAH